MKIFYKKSLELTGKLMALIFTPIVVLIGVILATMVFLNLGESPLFFQKRVGYKGKSITICKIKTFHSKSNEISKIGQLIRPCGLDEILQIFSILKGDMRWFGPRPRMKEFIDDAYTAIILNHTRPGIFNSLSLNKQYHSTMILTSNKYNRYQMLYYDLFDLNNNSFQFRTSLVFRVIPVCMMGLFRSINQHVLSNMIKLPEVKNIYSLTDDELCARINKLLSENKI